MTRIFTNRFKNDTRTVNAARNRPIAPPHPLENDMVNVWAETWGAARDALRWHIDLGPDQAQWWPRVEHVMDTACWLLGERLKPIVQQAVVANLPSITKAASNAVPASYPRRRVPWAQRLRPRTYSPDEHDRLDITPTADPLLGTSPYHIEAAETITADLITYVSDAMKGFVQEMLGHAIRTGMNADMTGKWVANYVGLFPRWQRAVYNLWENMRTTGTPLHVMERRAADYADELIDARGLMIARTELMRAMNEGRQADILDRAETRNIDTAKIVKFWIAAPDACELCAYMGDPESVGDGHHGAAVVGIDTPFDTPNGFITVPPMHPHCRCTVNYEFPDESVPAGAEHQADDGDQQADDDNGEQ